MGLATSAGLNAYIPLLAIGLLGRYTDLINPPSGWDWLTNGWLLGALAVLLAIEMVADKIPVVDHINDVIQTAVRPTSGGLVFGAASSSQTLTVNDPSKFFSQHQWVPIAVGVVISFAVHLMKATARPIINATTVGFGGPIASVIEDVAAVAFSAAAIILPAIVLIFAVLLVLLFWRLLRRRRQRRAAAALAGSQPGVARGR